MPKETNYINEEINQPKPNFYSRAVLGTVGLVGIGVVAYKIGGPTGKLLNNIREKSIDKESWKAYNKWSQQTSEPQSIKDLQGTINKGTKNEFITTATPTETQINDASNNFFSKEKQGLTPQSLINNSRRLEMDIETLFEGGIPEETGGELTKLHIFRGHNFSTGGHQPELSKDIMVSKIQLETMNDYHRGNYRPADGAPEIDISDTTFSDDPYGNRNNIKQLHNFYMENDELYAKKYRGNLKTAIHEVRQTMQIKSVSDASIGGFSNTKMVTKKYGSVQELWQGIADFDLAPDKSNVLFESAGRKTISQEVIREKLTNKLNSSDLMTKYSKYRPQLTKIANQLERLRTMRPERINDVFIKEYVYGAGTNGRESSYIIAGLNVNSLNGKDTDITFKIPIAQDNVVPNVRGIGGRGTANVNYIVGSPFRMSDAELIDQSQRYMEEVNKIMTSSKMNDMFDTENLQKFQSEVDFWVANRIQDKSSALGGEYRDYFRSNQIRLMHHEQIHNRPNAQKRGIINALKVGRNSVKNINRLKQRGDNYVLVSLDLETINLDVDSPQFMPGHPNTSIWQYGIVEADSTGKILNSEQIASDHIFKEQRLLMDDNIGNLKKVLSSNTPEAQRLRRFAGYTKKTMGINDDFESLMEYRNMIKTMAGTDKTHVNSRYNKQVKSTREFSNVIKMRMNSIKKKYANQGKEVMWVTSNGANFDLELLANQTGDRTIKADMNSIDVQSATRLMTLGYHDEPSMNTSNLLSHYMNKRSMPNIVSFEHDAMGAVDALSNGKIITVGQSSGTSVKNFLQGKLSKYATQHGGAHNSAMMDSVANLGILQMMRDFHQKDDFYTLKDIDNYLKAAEGKDYASSVNAYTGMENVRIPGGGWMSFAMQSSNATSKRISSRVAVGHMMPFMSLNPGNKDMHQIYRNSWVKKQSIKGPGAEYMSRNPLISRNEVKLNEWMTKNSNWDMNHYAGQLQFNTIYSVNRFGSKEGLLQMTEDALGFSVHDIKTVNANELAVDSKLSNEMGVLFKRIETKAKVLAGDNNKLKKPKVTSSNWNEACYQVIQEQKSKGGLPRVNANSPIVTKTMVGDKEIKLKTQLPGQVTGIRLDTTPGGDGKAKFITEIMYEAKGDNLSGLAMNHLGTKSLVSKLNVKSAEIASGKFGLMGPIQANMNMDFLDKKYWGSMKHAMLTKGLFLSRHYQEKGTAIEKKQAKKAYSKLAGALKKQMPVTEGKNGTLLYGFEGLDMDPREIVERASKVSLTDITYGLAAVGHEATWNKKQMDMYYGWHGGGSVKKGRSKIKKDVKVLLDGLHSTAKKYEKATDTVAFIQDQKRLIQLLDPMTIIEKEIGENFEGKVASDKLIRQQKVPIFMQVLPDFLNPNSTNIGMWGGFQSFTPYNILSGKEPKYNHTIKWQKSYFDQIMDKGSYITPSTKRILSSSVGYATQKRLADASLKLERTASAMTNTNISRLLTDHALSIDEINQLIIRNDTIAKIDRDLKQMHARGDHTTSEKVGEALNQIEKHLNAAESIESKNEVMEKIDEMSIKNNQKTLEAMKEKQNWVHGSDVRDKWARLAKKKNNVFFLPSSIITQDSNGNYTRSGKEKFEFILEDMVARVNSGLSNKEPLDEKTYISLLKNLQKDKQYKELSKTGSQLFDMTFDPNLGKHKVSIGGFVMPANQHLENVAHFIGEGDYALYTNETRMTLSMLQGYKQYYTDVLENKKGNFQVHSDNLSMQWLKTLQFNIGMDKNSTTFMANNMSYIKGFQATYHSVDNAIGNAKHVLDQIDKSSTSIDRWFKENKKFSRAHVKSILNKFTTQEVNTLTVATSTFFNKNQVAALAGGGHIRLDDMIKKADDKVQKLFNEAKLGRSTLPGGVMLRFPINQNGTKALFEGNFFTMPDEVGKMIGIDKNNIYFNEALGSMIKADNDVDISATIIKAYSTIEDMNSMHQETKYSLSRLMNLPNVQDDIDKYNSSNLIRKTFWKNGNEYAEVARINTSTGSLFFENKSLNELEFATPGKEVGGIFSNLTSKEFVQASSLYRGSNAMKNHVTQIALGAWSKPAIGLWTNTLRERVHELFMANSAIAKNSTVLFEMIGDLSHGIAGESQDAIRFQKHGTVEAAFNMTEYLKMWNNPEQASIEQYKNIRENWINRYPENKQQFAGDTLDVLFRRKSALNLAKKYDPDAAKFMKQEMGSLLGRKNQGLADYIQYRMHDRGIVDQKLTDAFKTALRQIQGPGLAKLEHGINEKDYMSSFTKYLTDEFADNAVDKSFYSKYKGVTSGLGPGFRKGGKIAAIAGLSYLALNMFRPNQLSSSSNPLDAFIDLGTDINGHHVEPANELELPRMSPLEMVNASFSKKAFIKLNNLEDNEVKKHEKNFLNNYLQENISNWNRHSFTFGDSRGKTTYTNMSSNFGKFGGSDFQRRSNKINRY